MQHVQLRSELQGVQPIKMDLCFHTSTALDVSGLKGNCFAYGKLPVCLAGGKLLMGIALLMLIFDSI